MAKKATTKILEAPASVETNEIDGLKQLIARLTSDNEMLSGENNELLERNHELENTPLVSFEPDPYLVVIPFKVSEMQGNELMLAVRGWMRHFKEKFRIVIVGDVDGLELPELFGECVEIGVISHECKTENPPLDIVSKLMAVIGEFPEVENLIVTNDDIYPVNDFDITEVKMLKADGMLTDAKKCGDLYALNRKKTLKVLQDRKLPVHDYGSHLPMFYDVESLLHVIETYDLAKEAMLLGSLYFNTMYPTRVPFKLNMEFDNLKVTVGRPNANLKRLRELMPGKIFVNNSVVGWSDDMEKVIGDFV